MVTVSWRVKSWILQQHQLLSWILYLNVSKVRRVGGTDLYVDKPLRIKELEIMARIRVKNRKTDTDDSGSHGSGVREKRLGREDQKLSVLSSLSLPHEFPPSFLHEMGERRALNQRDSRSDARSVTGNILINRSAVLIGYSNKSN